MDLDLFDVIIFEMCSIFLVNGLFREVFKLNFVDYIWNFGNCYLDNILISIQYVFDGYFCIEFFG